MNINIGKKTPEECIRIGERYKSDSLLPRSFLAVILVLIFCGCDYYCLFTLFDEAYNSIQFFGMALALTGAITLDVPLSIFGNKLKAYIQGLDKNKHDLMFSAITAVGAFLVTYIAFFCFRMISDAGIDISATSTLNNTGGATAVSASDLTASVESAEAGAARRALICAKLVHAVGPLATSLASFCVGYTSANPLRDKIVANLNARAQLRSEIVHMDTKLDADHNAAEDYKRMMLASESDSYHAFTDKLKTEALTLKQRVYNLIMRKLGDPESVTTVTETADRTLMDSATDDLAPQTAAYNYLSNGSDMPRFEEPVAVDEFTREDNIAVEDTAETDDVA